MSKFQIQKYFSRALYDEICEVRATSDNAVEIVEQQAKDRKKRKVFVANKSGRLAILACDHPARMVVDSGDGSNAMGNRYELLARILRVLDVEGFDGVMVTPDLFEDLMILRYIWQQQQDPRATLLDERVIIGSMNRGGLKGTVFELDDRFTAFSYGSIWQLDLDGGKMMLRIDPSSYDSLDTMVQCARAISELSMGSKRIFLECFKVEGEDHKSSKNADSLIEAVSVAQALGNAPRNLWLKLPYCEDFERVALATTCPILLLGGSSKSEEIFLQEIEKGLASGANVRGVMVGRNVLFPKDGIDPKDIAEKVVKLVH